MISIPTANKILWNNNILVEKQDLIKYIYTKPTIHYVFRKSTIETIIYGKIKHTI